jgi:hypothetical protein
MIPSEVESIAMYKPTRLLINDIMLTYAADMKQLDRSSKFTEILMHGTGFKAGLQQIAGHVAQSRSSST